MSGEGVRELDRLRDLKEERRGKRGGGFEMSKQAREREREKEKETMIFSGS